MKTHFQNIRFIFLFLLSIFTLFLANLFTFDLGSRGEDCFEYMRNYGFPFIYSQFCEGPTFQRIFWLSLVGNIVFAIIISSVFGFLLSFVWSKITSKKLR